MFQNILAILFILKLVKRSKFYVPKKKNRSIQLNLKKQIKKDYLVQTPFNKKVITNIGK